MLPLKYARFWSLASSVVVGAALYTCLAPIEMLAPELGLFSDKLEHSVGYVALALWFGGLFPPSRYWAVGLGLLGMGIGVEILQGAMDLGRHADVRDVLANSLGIVAGLLLARVGLGQWAQRLEAYLNDWFERA